MHHRYLITGGAGFIGSNLADHCLTQGREVTILDNLSRPGAEKNLQWLRGRHGSRLNLVRGDVREAESLTRLVEDADVVVHLAAQVAVTTSVTNPREDFEINALGTFNVMEAVRKSSSKPIVLYSSTNKVYGKMDDLDMAARDGRYAYANCPYGIAETRPLDFYSPYGCSKGVGDQYVLDYARIYGLRTVVFRQSCIYGPRQFGMEDQGWVAWFAIQALNRRPVTIFGDGKQVRDVLFVDELIGAYDAAVARIDKTSGSAYNIGGGPSNTLSLLELIELISRRIGHRLDYSFDVWRPGDQLIFVSDVRKAAADFGWEPRVRPDQGIEKLVTWLQQSEHTPRA